MPDGARGKHRRRRRISWGLMALAAIVFVVDVTAAAVTIVDIHRSNHARGQITAALSYQPNLSLVAQETVEAESAGRGYLLTGRRSYLVSMRRANQQLPGMLASLRQGSSMDPGLRHDYARLRTLLSPRVRALATALTSVEPGLRRRRIRTDLETPAGNRLTDDVVKLVAAMGRRSSALIASERAVARDTLDNAYVASLAACVSSAVILLMLVTLFRNYTMTEAARRESRLAQLEAERLNIAKSGFLSRVSHELRTPLGAIIGFGQLLERDLVEPSERETVAQMLSAGRHLLSIVDELLDLSRIESDDLRLSLAPVQVSEAIAEATSLIQPTADQAQVTVSQRPIDADLHVLADHVRLVQVLLNLLSNAVKYNRRPGHIIVSAARAGGLVRIEVADSGLGIASDAISRLFTPFERLDAASRGIEGHGLGLVLARGIVESMGGRLQLSSEEGVGTTVVVELRAARPVPDERRARDATSLGGASPASLGAASPAALTPAPHGLRVATSVLYIEDNPSNRRLVERIFGLTPDLGLTLATDGRQGIELAKRIRPDLILLDLHLPDMPGEQVLATLRADPELAPTPVIVVSADASQVQARRLRAAGADGYLSKPFDIDSLLAAIRTGGTVLRPGEGSDLGEGLLDPPMLASLHVLAANPAVGQHQITQMLQAFREDSLQMLDTLHRAAADGDLAAVQREAHRLAGGAGAVAAGRLRNLCQRIERHAKLGQLAEVRELDAALQVTLEQTWTALATDFGTR